MNLLRLTFVKSDVQQILPESIFSEKLALVLQTTSYALKQGEEAQITINVSSEVGGYDIEVLSASFLHIPVYNKINVTKELFNISFGPIYIQTNDSNYTLRITPTRR